jgi:hypothetical protein
VPASRIACLVACFVVSAACRSSGVSGPAEAQGEAGLAAAPEGSSAIADASGASTEADTAARLVPHGAGEATAADRAQDVPDGDDSIAGLYAPIRAAKAGQPHDARCQPLVETTFHALEEFFRAERARVDALALGKGEASIARRRLLPAVARVLRGLPALCRTTAHGTWAVVFSGFAGAVQAGRLDNGAPGAGLVDYVPIRVQGRAALVFVPAAGDAGTITAPLGPEGRPALAIRVDDPLSSGGVFDQIVSIDSGDTDGDGADELLVVRAKGTEDYVDPHENATKSSFLFSARGDRIVPLAGVPARIVFDRMKDVDGDGRADLLSSDPFVAVVPGNLGDVTLEGPLLAFHSVAGGAGGEFSRSDAAAAAYARSLCPAPPTRIVARPEPGLPFYFTASADDVLKNIVCARLWGLPEATVAGWIEAASGGPTLVAWATAPVPLTLRPSSDLGRDAH